MPLAPNASASPAAGITDVPMCKVDIARSLPNRAFYYDLRDRGFTLHAVGDALSSHDVLAAMHEGYRIARPSSTTALKPMLADWFAAPDSDPPKLD